MAIFDFLSQPIGGYEDPNAALDTGGFEFNPQRKSDITWGQLLGALAQYGSSNKTTQTIGSYMQRDFGLPPNQASNVFELPRPVRKQSSKTANDSMADIMGIIGFFGGF